ncbi:type III secretion protein U [Rhizobium leguminosarum]|uniref:Type III secretion protein U n=1 Tax=Rhizobium leguminosarum TaxID=384 RepID=A0AAE2MPZ6_RHILE|nr:MULTISPECIES: EscU/YscU/HrcU family type III secretion system export apparatus switch protein [Rhizobium]MBB4293120.1 type III secretion protein U [Rhizobium leguminosarum]MBB4300057.1 type III secretion protein U [Rhizobium leguminosarum]MBB4311183.1 type III secretion protein U [Rhizobium leguminosarum]MBB4435410.1 type III secretion protein U [Rhizobium esperanzae]MBB4532342.1 type III secretion protein U [Rhizobium leguminosarum]
MAKNDDTEEKTLPPSRVKLDRLRREGQVPRSKEIPVAISVLAIAVYVTWELPGILEDFARSFDAGLQSAARADLSDAVTVGLSKTGVALLDLIWLPLAMGLAATIVVSILDAQGFPVSFKHMSFDFTRLNPFDGIKRLFSLASIAEFLKGLVKFVLLAAAGGGAILYFLNGIFWAPLCGEACSLSTTAHLLGSILVIAAGIMVAAAFFDIRISRALFRHEHRMTKTEARREYKDTQGDPKLKSARRQIGAEMRSSPPRKEGPGRR